jgi:RNA polymerase sigma-70 factor (ECF subfamily)
MPSDRHRPKVPSSPELDPGEAAVGSEPDFEALRERLEVAVARVCPFWLHDQREDLVQTALVRIMEIVKRERGESSFNATYLWRTAYSVTLDEIRRVRRKREVPLEEEPGGRRAPGRRPDPERVAALREAGEGVRSCLRGLLSPRRRAVLLHFLGYAPRDAAVILGKSARQISNLLHRGLGDLRNCLERRGLAP